MIIASYNQIYVMKSPFVCIIFVLNPAWNLSHVLVGTVEGTPLEVTIINTTVTIQYTWDINGDTYVNIIDLVLIGQHWSETGTPCWIPVDVNCDGIINILDMILVGQHWTG